MTENQQKIIDSLIAEFNSRNEAKAKRPFKLIDVDEFDAINQRHIELTADAKRTKDLWDDERDRYIDELIQQIKEDIGDRLCVKRGSDISGNQNLSNYIYIYNYDTPEHYIWEKALRFEFVLVKERRLDDVTREYYDYYTGFKIERHTVQKTYKDEVEFFNCQHTKNRLKELLS